MNAIDYLMAHGVRPSIHRTLVMQYLLDNRTHPTVDEIYSTLSESNPTLSRTTVYNVLKLLQQYGAIIALTIDDKNVRYDADTTDHAHFRCTKCGLVYDFKQPEVLQTNVDDCFKIEECHVYYRGLCPQCLEE